MAPFARYAISTMRAQDRASFASWLGTVVYAITISEASGEVATEHSVLRPIAKLHGNIDGVLYYPYFHKLQFP